MPYIFRRGASIPFTQTYYDSTGGVTTPTSVRVWITYTTTNTTDNVGSFPYRGARKTTSIALTTNSTGGFTGSWASSMAAPGWVYYHIKPSETTLDVVDGAFDLRGNPANVASS
jgi:hypothetical protein